MNEKFANSTTQIGFGLLLSKRQSNSLLRLLDCNKIERQWVIGVDGLNSLERKGLVYWNHDADGRPNGFGGLTYVGKLVAALLVEAGLTVENTNTSITTKRIERNSDILTRNSENATS